LYFAMIESRFTNVKYLLKHGVLLPKQYANKWEESLMTQLFKRCYVCLKENGKNYCSQCKSRLYCGKQCQKIDWKQRSHKHICNQFINQRKNNP
jgi:hypothetical protein